MISEDIVSRYRDTVCGLKSDNQIHQFHIALGHVVTPLEINGLVQAGKNQVLPQVANDWLEELAVLLRRYNGQLVSHTRHTLHQGMTLYKGHPTPGQERHLLLAFTGDAMRLMTSIFIFLQECKLENLDVLLLSDRSRRFYLHGIEGFAPDIESLIGRLPTLYDKRDYRSVVSLGTSGGGLAALWAGIALNLDKAISVGGPSHLYTDSRLASMDRPFAGFERLVESRKGNLPELVYTLGDQCEKDQQKLNELRTLVPMTVVRVEGCSEHNILHYLNRRGQHGAFMRNLIATPPRVIVKP